MIELTNDQKQPVKIFRNDYFIEDRRLYPHPIVLFTYPKGKLQSQQQVELVAVAAFTDYSAEMADSFAYIERELDGKLSFYTSFAELPKRRNYSPVTDRANSIENLKAHIRSGRLDKPIFQRMRENFASLCKFNSEFDFYFTEDKIFSVKPEDKAEFEKRIQTPGVWHSKGTQDDYKKYISYATYPWVNRNQAPLDFLENMDIENETDNFFDPKTWDLAKVMMDLARKSISLQVQPGLTSIWDAPYVCPRGSEAKAEGTDDLYPMATIEGIVANAGGAFTEALEQLLPAIDTSYLKFTKANNNRILPSPFFRTVLPTSRLEIWSNFSHMRAEPECFLPSRYTMMTQIVSNHVIATVAQDPNLFSLFANEEALEDFEKRVYKYGLTFKQADLRNIVNLSWVVNFYFYNHAELLLAANKVTPSFETPFITPGPIDDDLPYKVRKKIDDFVKNGAQLTSIRGGQPSPGNENNP